MVTRYQMLHNSAHSVTRTSDRATWYLTDTRHARGLSATTRPSVLLTQVYILVYTELYVFPVHPSLVLAVRYSVPHQYVYCPKPSFRLIPSFAFCYTERHPLPSVPSSYIWSKLQCHFILLSHLHHTDACSPTRSLTRNHCPALLTHPDTHSATLSPTT